MKNRRLTVALGADENEAVDRLCLMFRMKPTEVVRHAIRRGLGLPSGLDGQPMPGASAHNIGTLPTK